MKIYLKNVSADTRKIDKWTWAAGDGSTEKTIFLQDATDILYPVVCLNYDAGVLTSGYNYCYIPDFKRYYFINGITCDDGKRIYIHCAIDVLNTYKTGILSAPCNVIRSESAGINAFHDEKLPLCPDECFIQWAYLESPFTRTAGSYNTVVGVFNAQS